jgi:imidazolonepropionase
MIDLLVRNGLVVDCRDGIEPRPGAVGVKDGRIVHVGPEEPAAERVLDAGGGVVLPGLVDPHTHLVFAGSRIDELARKMAGEDYRKIAAEGGGIASTVHATRAASDDTLFALAAARARALRAGGVTTVEVKSGYGLSTADELRLLRVARRLEREGIVRTSVTFLGAHAVPPERRDERDRYVDEVVTEMIPAVSAEGLADACDVYCDDGAFSLAETRRILVAAKDAGLGLKAHAGQFADLGAAELLAELGARSADHLEQVSEAGAAALGRAGVVAVLLPGAWRTLRQTPPDVARLRGAGVAIAIGTDCNPGTSPCTDLALCAALAVRDARLTLPEAVLGVTAHAARAAGVAGVGRIEIGAHGDLAVFPQRDPRALGYAIGGLRPRWVVLGGRVVHEGDTLAAAQW